MDQMRSDLTSDAEAKIEVPTFYAYSWLQSPKFAWLLFFNENGHREQFFL